MYEKYIEIVYTPEYEFVKKKKAIISLKPITF